MDDRTRHTLEYDLEAARGIVDLASIRMEGCRLPEQAQIASLAVELAVFDGSPRTACQEAFDDARLTYMRTLDHHHLWHIFQGLVENDVRLVDLLSRLQKTLGMSR